MRFWKCFHACVSTPAAIDILTMQQQRLKYPVQVFSPAVITHPILARHMTSRSQKSLLWRYIIPSGRRVSGSLPNTANATEAERRNLFAALLCSQHFFGNIYYLLNCLEILHINRCDNNLLILKKKGANTFLSSTCSLPLFWNDCMRQHMRLLGLKH